jgi:hypothetical protein
MTATLLPGPGISYPVSSLKHMKSELSRNLENTNEQTNCTRHNTSSKVDSHPVGQEIHTFDVT